MGVKTLTGGGKTEFWEVNGKKGNLRQSVKNPDNTYSTNELEPGRGILSGLVVGFELKDKTFKGEVVGKILRLKLEDPDPSQPRMFLDMSAINNETGPSALAIRVLNRINCSDLSKPIDFQPWFMAKGTAMAGGTPADKDMVGVAMKQNGQKLNEDYGDGEAKLPECPKVKVGNKEVRNTQPWEDLLFVQLENLTAKLADVHGHNEGVQPESEGIDPAESMGEEPGHPAPRG